MGKQGEFVGEAAAVATEATVGGDDAVTRNKNAEWVPADGITDSAGGNFVGAGGDGAVGGGLTPGDLTELVRDGLTEGGDAGKAVGREWSGEVTGEIAI